MDDDDWVPTGVVRYIVVMRSGGIEVIPGGKSSPDASVLPHNPGDGVHVGSLRCEVISVLYTPLLASTWQVFVKEN